MNNEYTFAIKCYYKKRQYDSTDLLFTDGSKKEAIIEALEMLEKDKNITRVTVHELKTDTKIAEII